MASVQYEGKDLEAMSFARNYHREIARIFEPYIGAKVGEVGSGSGNFSELLLTSPRIQELTAIEPSLQMYPLLEKKFAADSRVKKHQNFFSEIAASCKDYFDSMVYVNVMEHVEHDDDEMQLAYGALREGGHLCIFVPALAWLYSDFDAQVGHYRRYTKRELEEKMRSAGFEIVLSRYFDFAGILPWYVVFKLLKKKLSPGSAGAYDTIVVPVSSWFERLIPPPIGKNVILIGRKKTV